MALGAAPERVLVESDFLFGLRSSDGHHAHVVEALKRHRAGALSIQVLSSAVVEVKTVLHSRGLEPDVIEDTLSLMDAILAQHGVRGFIPLELGDAVLAEKMRRKERRLGFFDSLHAAVSQRLAIRLLSSEQAYADLALQVLDLDSL